MTTPFKGMKAPAFDYPKLAWPDIAKAFAQLEIPCTVEELKAPDADTMKRLCFALVEFMMGISRDELRAAPPQFAAMELMSHPELHEESTIDLTLMRAYVKLARASGVPEPGFTDLWAPNGPRARIIFSAIINFAKFRQDRLQSYVQFSTQTRNLVELRQQLEAQHEKLTAGIAELQAQRLAEEPVIKELERDNLELHGKLSALVLTHGTVKEEAAKLKAAAAELDLKVKEHALTIANYAKESDKLKSQIVRSPERMKKSIADMNASVATGKREIAELDGKARELRLKHHTLETLHDKIQERIGDLKECDENLAKSKRLYRDIKESSTALQHTEQTIADLVAQSKHLKAETSHVAERLLALQDQFAAKHSQSSVALAKVEAERAALLRVKEKDAKKIEENEAVVAQKKHEMARMEKAHRDELTQLKDTYHEFSASLRGYHEKLLEAMG